MTVSALRRSFESTYVVTAPPREQVAVGEMSVLITPRALVTVRKDDVDIDALAERWENHPMLRHLRTETTVLA